MTGARWRLVTARAGGAGALAVYEIAGEIGVACDALGLAGVGVGDVRVRRFADIDRGVVVRPAPGVMLLMPHAGAAVMRRIEGWLEGAGVERGEGCDPRRAYPEAASLLEARMLAALARAASPLAVDLLLDQPRRWAAGPTEPEAAIAARSAVLGRLIEPARVAALGRPNIGKSTLLNALAGRSVSIVADEAGTTRDHVGVRLDLGGVVVDYIDTPGIEAGGGAGDVQREAQGLALRAAAGSEVVLLCRDARSEFPEVEPGSGEVLRVGLRGDLGESPGCDVVVCARSGAGVERLVEMVRERLVPRAVMEDGGVWRFWREEG